METPPSPALGTMEVECPITFVVNIVGSQQT